MPTRSHTLREDLDARRIDTLFIIGANPAYDTPGDLGSPMQSARSRFRSISVYTTTRLPRAATWHLPQSHPLESWSDIRAFDGTASIVQPLIRPLYDTPHRDELLSLIGGQRRRLIWTRHRSRHWRHANNGNADFERRWRQSLKDGVIADSAAPHASPPAAEIDDNLRRQAPQSGFHAYAVSGPHLFDGSMANNAWLQECPKPLDQRSLGQCAAYGGGRCAQDRCRRWRCRAVTAATGTHRGAGLDPARPSSRHVGRNARLWPHARPAASAAMSGSTPTGYGLPTEPGLSRMSVSAARQRQKILLRTQHFFHLDGEPTNLQPRPEPCRSGERALQLHQAGRQSPDALPPASSTATNGRW